jgi:hypothetical protein
MLSISDRCVSAVCAAYAIGAATAKHSTPVNIDPATRPAGPPVAGRSIRCVDTITTIHAIPAAPRTTAATSSR